MLGFAAKMFAIGFVVFGGAPVGAAVIIDDFSQGAQAPVSGGINVHLTGDPAHLIGGVRSLQQVDFGNPFLPSSTVEINTSNGQLNYDLQQAGGMQTFYGTWVAQPVNINFIANGLDHFEVKIDAVPGHFVLRLGVRDNSFSLNSQYYPIEGNAPGLYEVPISSFDQIDFTKVGGFYLDIRDESRAGVNGPGLYTISSFAAVPEPAEYGVVTAIGLAALGGLRRRFRSV